VVRGEELLGLPVRQVRRLQRKLQRDGDAALVHGLHGKPSNRRLKPELRQQVLAAYREREAGRQYLPHGRMRAVAAGEVARFANLHMTDIPAFPYEVLWGERVIRSVANLTRRDGEEFLALAPRVPVRTGGYDAQPLEKRQSAAAGARERGAAGWHHFPDSRAQFVGRRSSASSPWLREDGIEEGAEFEEVRDTKRGSALSRQEIGVGGAQIGPCDGDAEHRPVRELQ
jgi:hypothetical protein